MNWPRCIEEAYCYWDMLRGFGFPADELFFEVHGPNVLVLLHRGGSMKAEDTFAANAGPRGELTPELAFQLWQRFAEDLASGKITDLELVELYARSIAPSQRPEMKRKLRQRGFLPEGQA